MFFVSLMVMALYFEEKIQITSYPFIALNAAVLGITAAVCFKFKKQAVLNGARLIGILIFIISASLPFFKSDTIFICLLYSFLFYATDYAAYMGGYPIPTEKIIFRAFVNDIVVSVLFCTCLLYTSSRAGSMCTRHFRSALFRFLKGARRHTVRNRICKEYKQVGTAYFSFKGACFLCKYLCFITIGLAYLHILSFHSLVTAYYNDAHHITSF